MKLGLDKKVVFIAGSSREIGKCIAKEFLEEGAKVVITGREENSILETEKELRKTYSEDRLLSITGDLTEVSCISSSIEITLKKWKQIDALVANIGAGSGKVGWDIPKEEWAKLFQQNFWGAVSLAEGFIPELAKTSGPITFISSIVGIERIPCPLPYSSAKASLNHYVKNLSGLVGDKGIRINSVAPGNILFPGGTWEKKLMQDKEKFENIIKTEVPLQRFGRPEDIAPLVVFLSSEKSGFITGSCFVADGGQTRSR